MNLSKNKTDGFQKYLTSQKIILTVQAMRRPMYAPARRVSFGAFNHLVNSRLRHSLLVQLLPGQRIPWNKPVQRLLHPSYQLQTKNPAKLSTSSSLHHSGDFVSRNSNLTTSIVRLCIHDHNLKLANNHH